MVCDVGQGGEHDGGGSSVFHLKDVRENLAEVLILQDDEYD